MRSASPSTRADAPTALPPAAGDSSEGSWPGLAVTLVLMMAFVSRNNAQSQIALREMLGGLLDCAIALAFKLDGKIGIAMLEAAAKAERACAAQMAERESGAATAETETPAPCQAQEFCSPQERGTVRPHAYSDAIRAPNAPRPPDPAQGSLRIASPIVDFAPFLHRPAVDFPAPDFPAFGRRRKSRLGGQGFGLSVSFRYRNLVL
jgi:hypothetical protein